MQRLSPSDMLKNGESYYSLVVGVAKRARKIAEEAEENGEMLSEKPVQMAISEFEQGKFKLVEDFSEDDE